MLNTTVSALPRTPSGPDISQHTDHQPAPTEGNSRNTKKHRISYFEMAGGLRHVMLLSAYWINPCDV